MQTTDRVKENTGTEISGLAKLMLDKYRFEYAGSIPLDFPGSAMSFDVSDGTIIAGVKKDGEVLNGCLYARPTTGRTKFEKISDAFPAGNSAVTVCHDSNSSTIMHPRVVDGRVCISRYRLNDKSISVFPNPQGRSYINIGSIKSNAGTCTVTDIFGHRLVSYNSSMEIIEDLEFPEGWGFPVDQERLNDGRRIIGFRQEHGASARPEYSRETYHPDSYLAFQDDTGRLNRFSAVEVESLLRNEPLRCIISDENGNIYILTSRTIIKFDKDMEFISRADMINISRRFPVKEPWFNAGIIFNCIRRSQNRLYILDSRLNKRIYVFEIE